MSSIFLLDIGTELTSLLLTVFRCPNWCNKRGECTSPQEGGYCLCHYGFTGEDCSQRMFVLLYSVTNCILHPLLASIVIIFSSHRYIHILFHLHHTGLCPAGFDPVGLEDISARRTIRLRAGPHGRSHDGQVRLRVRRFRSVPTCKQQR